MLRIHAQDTTHITLKNWKFNRRNINRIAYEHDAEVIRFQPEIKMATLKDSFGRYLAIDEATLRYCPTCNQTIKS